MNPYYLRQTFLTRLKLGLLMAVSMLVAFALASCDAHKDNNVVIAILDLAILVLSLVSLISLWRSMSFSAVLNMQLQVVQALSDSADMVENVARAISIICTTFDFQFGALWLIDEAQQEIRCVSLWQSPGACDNSFAPATRSTKFKRGVGLAGRVWVSAEPQWIVNVQEDCNCPRSVMAGSAGYYTGFGFPVFSGNKLLGVLEVYRNRSQQPVAKLMQMLSAFGRELGQLIERRQSLDQLMLDARIAHFTAEIGEALSMECDSMEEMLRHCTDAMVKHLPVVFARIWTFNRAEQMLELQASSGMYTHITGRHARIPLGKYKIGLIAAEKLPLMTNSLSQDERVSDPEWIKREGMVSFVGYPLLLQNEVMGVVGAFAREPLPNSVLETFSSVAHALAVGIKRRIAEEQVASSERLFHQLAENVREVFFVAIPSGQFSYVSPVYEELWGESARELLKEPEAFLARIIESDRQRVAQFMKNGTVLEQSAGCEFQIARSDGSKRWIWMRLFPTFHHDGMPDKVYGIAHDITERKSAEKRVNEFYSTVSHELRTPLTSIHASLRLMECGVVGELPEKVSKLVTIARTESDRLIRLINDILDLRKLEAGKLELKLKNVDTKVLANLSTESVRGMADAARVQVCVQVDEPGVLNCDQDRMIQVLVNLLSNAIKFSPPGGTVRLAVSHFPDAIRFSVSDEGAGIPADQIGKLFQKFQQLDSSDSRQKGGSGLGLAITKAIVEQHGGTIGVDSTEGAGSTFWVELKVHASREFEEAQDVVSLKEYRLTRSCDGHKDHSVQPQGKIRSSERCG